MMRLHCPSCGESVPAERINIQQLVAVCPACDTVFNFQETVLTAGARPRKFKQPDRLHVEESEGRLELRYRWVFGAEEQKGLLVCLTLTFVPLVMTLATFKGGAPWLFSLLFLIAALYFALLGVASLVNATRISADEETIRLSRGPLPLLAPGEDWWYGERILSRADVVRVTCEQTTESRQKRGIARYYHVCLELADGDTVVWLKALPRDYAFYIAQRLEEFLYGAAPDAALIDEGVFFEPGPADGEMSVVADMADDEGDGAASLSDLLGQGPPDDLSAIRSGRGNRGT